MPYAETVESRLLDLDKVEDALVAILVTAGLPAVGKWGVLTQSVPIVRLNLKVGAPEGRRVNPNVLNLPGNTNSIALPLNVWSYELEIEVITKRAPASSDHRILIGLVAAQLLYKNLVNTFTVAQAPYHSITDIREEGREHEADDAKNENITTLTYSGMLNIRDSAWVA